MIPADLSRVLDESEARQLPALIDEWLAEQGSPRHWIARALRRDLALLTDHPELVVPCVYRHCAFLGTAFEAEFHGDRAVALATHGLGEAMVAWRDAWRDRQWLRALRPISPALDGPVIEEYRTALPGELAFSADGTLVGVVGEHATVAWERATGRRVASPRLQLRSRRWSSRPTPGRIILEGDPRALAIDIVATESARSVTELAGDRVIVVVDGGWSDDDERITRRYLIDTAREQIVWADDRHHDAAAATPDGASVVSITDRFAIVQDLATGEVVASWPASGDDLAVTDACLDAGIATRTGSVIRIWSPARSPAAERANVPSGRSFIAAAFSPDGARLLTNRVLCDARSGAILARPDLDGPYYLEGGPPRNGQRLTTIGIAEVRPFGFRLWDLDGALVVDDRARAARLSDVAAFDPFGRYHAIGRDRRLVVHDMRTGAVVCELALDDKLEWGTRMGFSPDGAQLWWTPPTGGRWIMAIDNPPPRRLADDDELPVEPDPMRVDTDGLFVLGDAAIPSDELSMVVSPDGTRIASPTSHYALE